LSDETNTSSLMSGNVTVPESGQPELGVTGSVRFVRCERGLSVVRTTHHIVSGAHAHSILNANTNDEQTTTTMMEAGDDRMFRVPTVPQFGTLTLTLRAAMRADNNLHCQHCAV